MTTTAIITPEYQINLPSELKKQLKPGDEYNIVVKENSLILEKIIKEKMEFLWGRRDRTLTRTDKCFIPL